MTVFLTGAGCGGPRWLTAEAKEILSQADQVVHDDLIHPDLLQIAPEGCGFHMVGKRKGLHSSSQEDIEALLVDLGGRFKVVVRLKGGDPFVFGRGGEEALALQRAQIPWRYVPGITAAIGGLGSQGIPLTHRGSAETATLVTGHRKDDRDDRELWERMAQAGGTRAIYMGASKGRSIARWLMESGEREDLPCSSVHWGGWGRSTRRDFSLKSVPEDLSSPSIIALGDVASLGLKPEDGPLKGLQVGIVRPYPESWTTARDLEALGADCYSLPLLKLKRLEHNWDRDAISRSDWLVLTSPRGAALLPEALDLRRIGGKVVSIGPGTSRALREIGIERDHEATSPTSEGLAEALPRLVQPGDKVCFFRNARSSQLPFKAVSTAGAIPLDLKAYSMEASSLPGEDAYRSCWERTGLDSVAFGSAALVEAYFDLFGPLPEDTVPVVWGVHCAEAVREIFKREPMTMEEPSYQGLVSSLVKLKK